MSMHKKVTKPAPRYFIYRLLPLSIITVLLAACGGGSGGGSSSSHSSSKQTPSSVNNTEQAVNNKIYTSADSHLPVVDASLSGIDLTAYNQLNMRRTACGFGVLNNNKQLQHAAVNHTNYLLYMNKHSNEDFQGHTEFKVDNFSGISNPYFTGGNIESRLKHSDGVGSKALPVNYSYRAYGESLSASTLNNVYLNQHDDTFIALSSMNSLLAAPYHMASMLKPYFTEVGISYGRDKLKSDDKYFGSVLEVVLATPKNTEFRQPTKVLSYPCNNTVGTQYELTHEYPNPFGNNGRDLQDEPIGQPIYIVAAGNIDVTNYKMTDAAGKQVALKALTHKNDPNKLLTKKEVILLPLSALKPSQAYRVSYQVSVDGGDKQTKSLVFHTKAKA